LWNVSEKKFRIKSLDIIKDDLDEARSYGNVERVFFCDGDALIIPQIRLEEILKLMNHKLMNVNRIGTYANN
jgi:hypothetical protein